MVTIMGLQDALNDFLQKEVASKFMLKTANRLGEITFREPRIIRSGWVLPKSIDDEEGSLGEEFPYIMPRILKVANKQNARESIVTMGVQYGVYDPGVYDDAGKLVDDGSGYRDFWNLVEATRLAFFEQQVIDNKYRIIDDFFEAEMFEDQEYPYWEGFCLTRWQVIYPQAKRDKIFY